MYVCATQEMALNIFVEDALLFFPCIAIHLVLALARPAIFLYTRLPAQSAPVMVSATLLVPGGSARPVPEASSTQRAGNLWELLNCGA